MHSVHMVSTEQFAADAVRLGSRVTVRQEGKVMAPTGAVFIAFRKINRSFGGAGRV